MRNKIKRGIFFVIGMCLCIYPIISGYIESEKQKSIIGTYEQIIAREENLEEVLRDAETYNETLNQTKGALVGNLHHTILSDKNYRKQLNINGNGIMGAIEIPKIHVDLPIWHGTEEEVLSNGAGHLQGSSLPVGGESTRCVLTSHRGLPSSKLFTRLDELKEGDLFYIHVCGEVFAYQVSNIEIIEPDELEKLDIIAGKDMVSLVTCTPYGINTHRLVVNGERVEYREKVYERIEPKLLSFREMIFFLLPFIFIGTALVKLVIAGRRRWKVDEKQEMCRVHDTLRHGNIDCGKRCKSKRRRNHTNCIGKSRRRNTK